jgi:hypothetical protein
MILSLAVCAVAVKLVRRAVCNYGQLSLVRYARQRLAGYERDKEHVKYVKYMRGRIRRRHDPLAELVQSPRRVIPRIDRRNRY